MEPTAHCQRCGAQLSADSQLPHCPHCLFDAALDVSASTIPREFQLNERRFGDYVLERQLGSGGMGVVYEARQLSLNRKVAIKFIRYSQVASPALLRRFTIEAEAAARLHHPNIVRIHEIGEAEGEPYFSMDLIEGESLRSKVSRGEFRVRKVDGSKSNHRSQQVLVARLMAKTARAVHHAHSRGVLHRDLKPANILVDANNEPHLTDFGLAKILRQSSEQSTATRLTRTGDVAGTPSYMAPEQIVSGPSTSAGDVYGLGAILYEMLTGRPPFQAETPLETMRQVQEQTPKPPRLINPLIDKDLETICLKCLEKDPHYRYATAEAFAEDLESWIELRPIKARPAGPGRRTLQWIKRNKLAASFIGTLILGLVAGLVLLQIVRAKEKKTDEERAFVLQGVMDQMLSEWHDPATTEVTITSASLGILSGLPQVYEVGRRQYTLGFPLEGDPVNFASKHARLMVFVQKEMSALLGEPVLLHLKLFKPVLIDLDLLSHSKADIIAVDPAAYLMASSAQSDLLPILRERLNQNGVWVTARPDLTDLKGLHGKSIVFPRAEGAFAAHGKARLLAAGLRKADLGSITNIYSSSHIVRASRREAVAMVLQGRADAGLTSWKRFTMDRHRGLRALDKFPVTDNLYVARAGLPAQVAEAFREARLRGEKVVEVKYERELDPGDSDETVHHVEPVTPEYLEQFRAVYQQAQAFDRN